MSSLRLQDRVSACHFTFADGRKCRTIPPANPPPVVAGLQTGTSAPQDCPVSPNLGEKLLETEENCYSQNG